MENDQYHGHKTLKDGTHLPLTSDEAERLWNDMERRREATAIKYPDEQSTLNGMCEAHQRLRDFGWDDACYCPKDGSIFEVIEAGSSGVHKCHYHGEWPKGTWWIHGEDGDLWPSRPILYRKLPNTLPTTER
jgi:hypothetical protein